MTIKKIVPSVLLLSLLVSYLSVFVPSVVSAQEDQPLSVALVCSLDGYLAASLSGPTTVSVESQFGDTVVIENPSNYVFSGVKTGVAFYESELDTVPSYWYVTPTERTVYPRSENPFTLDLDLGALPAGTYIVKTFAAQGDAEDVLAVALRDVTMAESVTVVKQAPQSTFLDTTVTVNGEVVNGTLTIAEPLPLNYSLETKNNGDVPFVNANLRTVVSQGTLPAGTAVRASTNDSLKLIPGGVRTTTFTDLMVEDSSYTLYTMIESEGVVTPLQIATLNIGDVSIDRVFTYLSAVGIADATEDTVKVTACVAQTETLNDGFYTPRPFGVGVNVKDEAGAVIEEQNVVIGGSEYAVGNSVEVILTKKSLANRLVTVQLEEQRSYSETPLNPNDSSTNQDTLTLDVIDSLELTYDCVEGECSTITTLGGFIADETVQKSFWFYAGIVIAAALLLYVMLRRLSPYEDPQAKKDESNHELQ